MNDAQILTVALALANSFLAVFIGVFPDNKRLNDVKELLAAKIGESREVLLKMTEVDTG